MDQDGRVVESFKEECSAAGEGFWQLRIPAYNAIYGNYNSQDSSNFKVYYGDQSAWVLKYLKFTRGNHYLRC